MTLIIAVCAAGAASVAIAMTGTSTPPAAGPPRTTAPSASSGGAASSAAPSTAPSSAALAAAELTREQAAIWIAAEVSHAAIVACDPLMCSALQNDGFPAEDLMQLSSGSADPLGASVVAGSLAVRSLLGARLADVYAPVVLASFGSGPNLIQVRASAVGSAKSYLASIRADQAARQTAGQQLARSKAIRANATARRQLTSGRVDSRLLITLAALEHLGPVRIVSFSDSGPGAGGSGPLRAMTIAATSPATASQVLTFLQAQRAPLLPIVTEQPADPTTELQIKFTAPSPLGLLGSGAST